MSNKIRVAVLFGGRSGEHEVSLVSASSVIENLDKEKYEVIPVGITKEGRWIAGPESMKLLKSGEAPSESNTVILAEPSTPSNSPLARGRETIPMSAQKRGLDVDVVFPVLHGPYGEDGTVQGFLELTGLPYVGCGVLGSAVCMDKVMQKRVLTAEKITQTPYIWFSAEEWRARKDKIISELPLHYPVFVKPANMGSSVGISKVKVKENLAEAVEDALRYDRKVVIEQSVENAREIEVSILGNSQPRASVLGEILPSNEFYDYDAKYVDGKTETRLIDDLPPAKIKEIQDLAIKAFKALDCEGLARVDFLLAKDGTPFLNEVNTMPGFTSISMYPKLWEATGLGYSVLLDELINLALERQKEKASLKISYEPKAAWYSE